MTSAAVLSAGALPAAAQAAPQAPPAERAPVRPRAPPAQSRPPRELPFAIADEKRLSAEDLAEKKEGAFVTGLPTISSDPLNGFGVGAEGYVNFNGSRSDPFFDYTPYRRRLGVQVFVTTRSQRQLILSYDEPYALGSKWRLRAEAAYEVNPNQLYFGTTERTLAPLASLYPSRSPFARRPRSLTPSYSVYDQRLATVRAGGPGEAAQVADTYYNYYTKQEAILNLVAERSFFDGRVRILGGAEAAYLHFPRYDGTEVDARDPVTGQQARVPNGTTRLTEDARAGGILGADGGFVGIVQAGVVYDTRDLEPDPSRGIYAELTNELAGPATGYATTFDKLFVQVKGYQPLFGSVFSKLVLAMRGGLGVTIGDAPFFEYQDEWSPEGSIEGLGGFHTLRGYKQSRFLARTMGFANFELRYRCWQTKAFGQTFGLMVLPLFDVGGVWDRPWRLNLANLRHSEGAGLRLAWNLTTILSLDYAVSEEDQQAFLELNHAF